MSREASGQALLAAHYRVDGHPFINPIQVLHNDGVQRKHSKFIYLFRRLWWVTRMST